MLADKGYGTKANRRTLKSRGLADGIIYRSSSTARNARMTKRSGSNRFVVERTNAWPRCGFHKIGARYERKEENWCL